MTPLRKTAFLLFLVLPVLCWAQSPESPKYTLEPVTVSNVAYPAQAREQKLHERVSAMMLVSKTGTVENVQVFGSNSILAQSAEQAIHEWKFKPVMKDGKPILVVANVTLDFGPGAENMGAVPEISPATEFPQRVRVSSSVSKGLILSKATPEYPAAAKAKHIHGAVVLAVVIGKEGTVTDVQLVSGPPELTAAAIDAVRQWRYRPYLLMGRPVEVQATVNVNFQ